LPVTHIETIHVVCITIVYFAFHSKSLARHAKQVQTYVS